MPGSGKGSAGCQRFLRGRALDGPVGLSRRALNRYPLWSKASTAFSVTILTLFIPVSNTPPNSPLCIVGPQIDENSFQYNLSGNLPFHLCLGFYIYSGCSSVFTGPHRLSDQIFEGPMKPYRAFRVQLTMTGFAFQRLSRAGHHDAANFHLRRLDRPPLWSARSACRTQHQPS